jgi:hypothetical protein
MPIIKHNCLLTLDTQLHGIDTCPSHQQQETTSYSWLAPARPSHACCSQPEPTTTSVRLSPTSPLQDLGCEAAGKPLPPQQLAQALAVVQALADVVGASGGGATAGRRAGDVAAAAGGKQQEVLLVPDEQGVLGPAAELAYDDAPWLDAPTAGRFFGRKCHPLIELLGCCCYIMSRVCLGLPLSWHMMTRHGWTHRQQAGCRCEKQAVQYVSRTVGLLLVPDHHGVLRPAGELKWTYRQRLQDGCGCI